jgi:hypothetical protein
MHFPADLRGAGQGQPGTESENVRSLESLTVPYRDVRTSNPLLDPEMLCSWLFKHFLASYITA